MSTRIIGKSEALQRVLEEAGYVAVTDYSIMIQGETGTGKELVARYIHEQSARAAGAFIAVNIAGCLDNLIDSELFGHEKGSFTGANRQRIGKLEEAGNGTIFLDEIGDLPRELQVKLLRVMQECEFQRLGGNETIPLKARVLAATNVDLQKNIGEGRFREDLFYRFGQVLKLPPLRERKGDIPLLVDHLIQLEEAHLGMPYPAWFDADCRRMLCRVIYEYPYHWPGNIRGLQIVLRSVLIKSVCHSEREQFEEQVIRTLEEHCCKDQRSMEKELSRLISNMVRENIASYPRYNISLRTRMNELLVDGISEGLDLALNVDAFRPQTGKELGDILGITTLSKSNHPFLPKGDNDYIVKALKHIGRRDELPEKVNEFM